MIPEEAVLGLQEALRGAMLEEADLEQRIGKAFKESSVQTPGMRPRDFVEAILKLREVLPS